MNVPEYPRIRRMSIQLLVNDPGRSVGFYSGILGFTVDFQYEDFYAAMVKDECSIHLKSGHTCVEDRKRKRENEDLDILFEISDVADFFSPFRTVPPK